MGTGSIDKKIAYEKLSLIAHETPRVMSAAVVLAIMFVLATYHELDHNSLITWLSLVIILFLFRILHYISYKKNHSIKSYKKDYYLFGIGLFLTALSWGMVAVYLFPSTPELRLFLVICIAGLTAGATTTNAYVYEFYIIMTISLLLPLIVVFLLESTEISYYIAGALLLYFGMVLMIAKKAQENIEKIFLVGYKNESLVKELQTTVQKEKEASQAKSIFLSTMSHEIRTPLNAILGYISVLKRNEDDATKLSHLNIINHSSQLLLGIINNVLDYTKLNNNKMTIELDECNIAYEINKQLSLFKPLCQNKKINLQSKIDTNIPVTIQSDTLRINQVLTNLLSNAVKFTPEYKSITLEALYKNDHIYFNIIDQGIGIALEAQSKIFDSFEQADSSTTRKYGGTGLGLAISYKIVQMFGSKLTVKSELSKGSTFSFNIPAKEVQAKNKLLTTTETIFNQESILVAEDIKTNQMLIKLLLDEVNLNSTLVNDGQEAIDSYNDKFSIVLMDINMPNVDGMEAMKVIKKSNPKAVIIALTANAMNQDKDKYIENGFDDYLSKPIDVEKLHVLLSKHLS